MRMGFFFSATKNKMCATGEAKYRKILKENLLEAEKN